MGEKGKIPFEDSVLLLEDPDKGSVIVILRLPDGATWMKEWASFQDVLIGLRFLVGSKGVRAERWMEKGWDKWLKRVEDERMAKD